MRILSVAAGLRPKAAGAAFFHRHHIAVLGNKFVEQRLIQRFGKAGIGEGDSKAVLSCQLFAGAVAGL